jgi:predicted translin family RNA/ssDNA-binding protein
MDNNTASNNNSTKRPFKKAPVESEKALEPLQAYFSVLSRSYDASNDLRERLIKLSRDITRNSKAVISTLQRCKGIAGDEAHMRAARLALVAVRTDFHTLLDELKGQDYWRFQRNFSGGVQEYIEAATLAHYLDTKQLLSLEEASVGMLHVSDDEVALDSAPRFPLSVDDYLSGIADLTGEMMRQCVARAGAGDVASARDACNFVRTILGGVIKCDAARRVWDFEKKQTVMQESLVSVTT